MKVLLSSDQIAQRVEEMGAQIGANYEAREPHLVGVLKGACTFLSDLYRTIDLPLSLDYIAVSAYGAATKTSGGPRSLKVASLLSKPSRRLVDVNVDYLGFDIDDHFVVGYGLDFNERYRNLKDVVIYGGTDGDAA